MRLTNNLYSNRVSDEGVIMGLVSAVDSKDGADYNEHAPGQLPHSTEYNANATMYQGIDWRYY